MFCLGTGVGARGSRTTQAQQGLPGIDNAGASELLVLAGWANQDVIANYLPADQAQ